MRRRVISGLAAMAVAAGVLEIVAERRDRASRGGPILAVDVPGPAIDDRLTGSKAELLESARPWRTDLDRRSAPAEKFLPVLRRDVITAIDRPRSVPTRSARELRRQEPVIVVRVGAAVRAYPVRILVWHEIVNDRLGGRPITVTYCPLCNSAVAFDRRVDGRTLTFGTTGNLRRANLVMYDRQTESWWQQMTGEAVVGELTGARLRPLDAQTVAFSDFSARYRRGTVLSFDTGFKRPYETNPYAGYEALQPRPGLFRGRLDLRLPAKERVVALYGDRETVATPVAALRRSRVLTLSLDGSPVVLLFRAGARSALDTDDPRDASEVGAIGAFRPVADGHALRLNPTGSVFIDERTGSRFDITGHGVVGPLAGTRLKPVRHDVQFWFAVAAFAPDVRLFGGSTTQ